MLVARSRRVRGRPSVLARALVYASGTYHLTDAVREKMRRREKALSPTKNLLYVLYCTVLCLVLYRSSPSSKRALFYRACTTRTTSTFQLPAIFWSARRPGRGNSSWAHDNRRLNRELRIQINPISAGTTKNKKMMRRTHFPASPPRLSAITVAFNRCQFPVFGSRNTL